MVKPTDHDPRRTADTDTDATPTGHSGHGAASVLAHLQQQRAQRQPEATDRAADLDEDQPGFADWSVLGPLGPR